MFVLVTRELSINTMILMRCVCKNGVQWVEDSELLKHLTHRHSLLPVSDFNELVEVYNRSLWDKVPNLYVYKKMLSNDFNDNWNNKKCQLYEGCTGDPDTMFTFTCNRDGPVCSGCELAGTGTSIMNAIDAGVTPLDVREKCEQERKRFGEMILRDNFPEFEDTVFYMRMIGLHATTQLRWWNCGGRTAKFISGS